MLSLSRPMAFQESGAQGGIRTRDALEYSSVARVTAVHTFGRLPRAADRAILPRRIQAWIGREPGNCHLGSPHAEKMPRLSFPEAWIAGMLAYSRLHGKVQQSLILE